MCTKTTEGLARLGFFSAFAMIASAAHAGDCDSLGGQQFIYVGDPGGSFFSQQLNGGELFTFNVGDLITVDFTLPPGSSADVTIGADVLSQVNNTGAQRHIVDTIQIPDSGGDGSPTVTAIGISGSTSDADTLLVDFLCDAANGGGDPANAAAQSNAFVETFAIGFNSDLNQNFGIPGPIGAFAPGPDNPQPQENGSAPVSDQAEPIIIGDFEQEVRRQGRVRRNADRIDRGEAVDDDSLFEIEFELDEDERRRQQSQTGEPTVFEDEAEAQETRERLGEARKFNDAKRALDQTVGDDDSPDAVGDTTIAGDEFVDLIEELGESLDQATGAETSERSQERQQLSEERDRLQEERAFFEGDDGDPEQTFQDARQERLDNRQERANLESEIADLFDSQFGRDTDAFGNPINERFTEEELADPEAAIEERRRRQQELDQRNAQIDSDLNDRLQEAAERFGVQVDTQVSADDSAETFFENEDLRQLQEARDAAAQENQDRIDAANREIFDSVTEQAGEVDQSTLDQAIDDAARNFSGFDQNQPPPTVTTPLASLDAAETTRISSFALSPLPNGAAFAYQVQPPADPRWDVWVEGEVSFSEDDRRGVASQGTALTLKTGARRRFETGWAAGGALRYNHAESEQNDGSAEFEGDAFAAAAFAQTQAGGIDLQATIAYERGSVDATFRNGGATATGDFSVNVFSGQVDAGRPVALSPEWTLTPNAAVSYTVALRDEYTLSDGTFVDGDTLRQGSALLGADLSGAFAVDFGPIIRIEPAIGGAAVWNFAALEPGALANGSRVDAATLGLSAEAGLTAAFRGGATLSATARAVRFESDQSSYALGLSLTIPLN